MHDRFVLQSRAEEEVVMNGQGKSPLLVIGAIIAALWFFNTPAGRKAWEWIIAGSFTVRL